MLQRIGKETTVVIRLVPECRSGEFYSHRNTHDAAGAGVRHFVRCGKDYVTQVHIERDRMRQPW